MIPVAILAGGLGTRLSEETVVKPKPMVEIGNKPILWHIMKCYYYYGFSDFVIALGYKGEIIRDFFANYNLHNSTVVSFSNNKTDVLYPPVERWKVTCLDTGLNTQISGRIKRILNHTGCTTMVTYGDGLSNINLKDLLDFHMEQRKLGRLATVTAVRPPARFGRIVMDGDKVSAFDEKPLPNEKINGGFMVLEPEILKLGPFGDDENFEKTYLPMLARNNCLSGYVFDGFWQCMDTIREKQILNDLWNNDLAKWRVWDD